LTVNVPGDAPAAKQVGSSDDAYFWFTTFIAADCVTARTVGFKGDNRGFSTSPYASARTRNSVRVDWETKNVYLSQFVASTTRYDDCTNKQGAKTLTAGNGSSGLHRTESGNVRMFLDLSVANPFEAWYGNIDYEWERVATRDGGVAARGMHDGAPSYEIFYEKPFSSARSRPYTHSEQSFYKLYAPMDAKGLSWCHKESSTNSCPSFSSARWL
jgi:hypothetical protein